MAHREYIESHDLDEIEVASPEYTYGYAELSHLALDHPHAMVDEEIDDRLIESNIFDLVADINAIDPAQRVVTQSIFEARDPGMRVYSPPLITARKGQKVTKNVPLKYDIQEFLKLSREEGIDPTTEPRYRECSKMRSLPWERNFPSSSRNSKPLGEESDVDSDRGIIECKSSLQMSRDSTNDILNDQEHDEEDDEEDEEFAKESLKEPTKSSSEGDEGHRENSMEKDAETPAEKNEKTTGESGDGLDGANGTDADLNKIRESIAARQGELPTETMICSKCNVCFRTKTVFAKHVSLHSEPLVQLKAPHGLRAQLLCPIMNCNIKCDCLPTIIEHCRYHHSVENLLFDFIEFSDMAQFRKWREEMELLTVSKFRRSSGKQNTFGKSIYFNCHHSGPTQQGKDNRNLRQRASKKLGRTCTAFFHLRETADGKVALRGCLRHLGHEQNVRCIPLPENTKTEIARMILQGMHERDIVDVLRERSTIYERQHYVQPYEVRNVHAKLSKNNYTLPMPIKSPTGSRYLSLDNQPLRNIYPRGYRKNDIDPGRLLTSYDYSNNFARDVSSSPEPERVRNKSQIMEQLDTDPRDQESSDEPEIIEVDDSPDEEEMQTIRRKLNAENREADDKLKAAPFETPSKARDISTAINEMEGDASEEQPKAISQETARRVAPGRPRKTVPRKRNAFPSLHKSTIENSLMPPAPPTTPVNSAPTTPPPSPKTSLASAALAVTATTVDAGESPAQPSSPSTSKATTPKRRAKRPMIRIKLDTMPTTKMRNKILSPPSGSGVTIQSVRQTRRLTQLQASLQKNERNRTTRINEGASTSKKN
ncbi:unnamed protein product [Caenorhabditis bovis]|uniref:C2H2-type domain-containing protein n=1 Tax=Caenorhabditis bovis TaxID=2654633 RepID=A0A8S1FCT9_9PELO|nr:unnamed protein product [Caenorhabditis bovis]